MARRRISYGGGGSGDLLRGALLNYLSGKVSPNETYNPNAPISDTNQAFRAKNWLSKSTENSLNTQAAMERLLAQAAIGDQLKLEEGRIPIQLKVKQAETDIANAAAILLGKEGVKRELETAEGKLPINLKQRQGESDIAIKEKRVTSDIDFDNSKRKALFDTEEGAKRVYNSALAAKLLDPSDVGLRDQVRNKIAPELIAQFAAEAGAAGNKATRQGTIDRQETDALLNNELESATQKRNEALLGAEQSRFNLEDAPTIRKIGMDMLKMKPDIAAAELLNQQFKVGPPDATVIDVSQGGRPVSQLPSRPNPYLQFRNTLRGGGNTPAQPPTGVAPTTGSQQYIRTKDGTLIDPVTKQVYRLVTQ